MIPLQLRPVVLKTIGLRTLVMWVISIFVAVKTKTEKYSMLFGLKYMEKISLTQIMQLEKEEAF